MKAIIYKFCTYFIIAAISGIGFYQLGSVRSSIKIIDLQKIMIAESVLANKTIVGGNNMKPWLATVNSIGKELRNSIRAVAGMDSLVLIAPCVVQGGINITDQVLLKLGLPQQVPTSLIPMNAIYSTEVNSADKQLSMLQKNKIPVWMLP